VIELVVVYVHKAKHFGSHIWTLLCINVKKKLISLKHSVRAT